jgi:hypothetical protein
MSITYGEARQFFDYVEKQAVADGKITLADLEKALAVDIDGDGQITDIEQPSSDGVTTFTEKGILQRTINQWITNAGSRWSDDQALSFAEFWAMVSTP